ncbi:hypothetical protein [Clostridium tyrobutyricum]|jgi:hypothetical protein|uniref:hypothetical protein n=1 Tax=Clostridium tyrobutyricum TaxID=1519 RepID=UPI001C38472C|nr:hypothetical protein [Clostridium tyrobutyricum]MBV4424308.1 hypothetical protein [Clostridium tyrobutyricum]
MIRKETFIKIATLLPLIGSGIKMKNDIMDEAENNYLNPSHKDFRRTISNGKTAMRKSQEWAIQQAFEEGLVQRTQKRGEYYISKKGIEFVEDFAANIDINKSIASRYYSKIAIYLLEIIYSSSSTLIAQRQSNEVRKLLGI